MIKIGGHCFSCDECPICDCMEHRCDKVGQEFCTGGTCEDATVKNKEREAKGKRKNSYRYRRKMAIKKDKDLRKIFTYGYRPNAGYPKYNRVDGKLVDAGYIQYPKNSNTQKSLKRQSNRIVRRSKEIYGKGSRYKKHFDYWWSLY